MGLTRYSVGVIGTRTARTVVFGLLGVLAGLVLPVAASARTVLVTSTPVMRVVGADIRGADDLSRAAPASRANDAEGRTAQLPLSAHLPQLGTDHPTLVATAFIFAVGALVLASVQPAGARAPPRWAL